MKKNTLFILSLFIPFVAQAGSTVGLHCQWQKGQIVSKANGAVVGHYSEPRLLRNGLSLSVNVDDKAAGVTNILDNQSHLTAFYSTSCEQLSENDSGRCYLYQDYQNPRAQLEFHFDAGSTNLTVLSDQTTFSIIEDIYSCNQTTSSLTTSSFANDVGNDEDTKACSLKAADKMQAAVSAAIFALIEPRGIANINAWDPTLVPGFLSTIKDKSYVTMGELVQAAYMDYSVLEIYAQLATRHNCDDTYCKSVAEPYMLVFASTMESEYRRTPTHQEHRWRDFFNEPQDPFQFVSICEYANSN